MVPSDWIEHRRPDGERVGWIRIDGDRCIPYDLLGRALPAHTDWLEAEQALEELGIGYLARRYAWDRPGKDPLVVLITRLDTERVVIKNDDWGAIDIPSTEVALPWPAPPELREWTGPVPAPSET